MDANQEFNMKLKQELEKRDIVFAYPTHTVYLNREKVDQEAKGSRDQERKRGR